MLSNQSRSLLTVIALALFLPIAFLQSKIDPYRKFYEPLQQGNTVNQKIVTQLPVEFAVGAMTGFREAVAGLLWVRTDEFFDNGDYGAIVPMVRMITWLDPNQIDVYETGAWHMDYNFTDVSGRSDRRYLPLSLALMNEGIANNPDVPDLYSDMGFVHYYRKLGDFVGAAQYFAAGQSAMERLDERAAANPGNSELQDVRLAGDQAVTTSSHGLAHAYESLGDVPQAEAQWEYCIERHEKDIQDGRVSGLEGNSPLDTARRNLFELQQRAKYRPIDTKVPVDFHFNAQLVRVAPRVFVFKGTLNATGAESFDFNNHDVVWGPINGCRAEVRLTDQGYLMPQNVKFELMNSGLTDNVTIMQDSISCRNGHFERKIDMSQDPDIYSFTAPKYTITVWFNPSNPIDCPPNVQDRIGWLGNGLKKDQFTDDSGLLPGTEFHPVKGLRFEKKVFTLTREDILGLSNKTEFN